MPQPTIPDALWRLPASQTAALVRAHRSAPPRSRVLRWPAWTRSTRA